MGEKQIEFEIHMEEMDITANASLLKRVWVNLLDNAVKFSPAGESFYVTLQKEGGDAVFAVRDNGSGMDEKTKPFILINFTKGTPPITRRAMGWDRRLSKRLWSCTGEAFRWKAGRRGGQPLYGQAAAALTFGLPFSVFLFVVPLEALFDVHQNVRVFF